MIIPFKMADNQSYLLFSAIYLLTYGYQEKQKCSTPIMQEK